jgi:hypothetical protein
VLSGEVALRGLEALFAVDEATARRMMALMFAVVARVSKSLRV